MLYPGIDLSKTFHEDHIYPKSRFSRSKLAAAGIPTVSIDEYLDKVNRLPNLQLLPGIQNIEKQAKLPSEWLAGANFASQELRLQYELDNDIDIVGELTEFLQFFDKRRDRMNQRLRVALGLSIKPDPLVQMTP